jgi:hypothetical protein
MRVRDSSVDNRYFYDAALGVVQALVQVLHGTEQSGALRPLADTRREAGGRLHAVPGVQGVPSGLKALQLSRARSAAFQVNAECIEDLGGLIPVGIQRQVRSRVSAFHTAPCASGRLTHGTRAGFALSIYISR